MPGAKDWACCLPAMQSRYKPFEQTIVILRHSERADQVDPTYKDSEEGKQWPFDTPITDAGVKLARDVALELAEVHRRARFALVVCSPYRRCLQTAAEVANLLKLPVLIDQEVGEVWEEAMPKENPPHRSPKQLLELTKGLGIRVKNPMLPEGGYKLFGQRPQVWPETTKMGHKRCLVRIETWIEHSAANQQNVIIVAHAPAIAAMTDIFQRGQVDIERLDYCARVVARRCVKRPSMGGADEDKSVYEEMWDVDTKGVHHGINMDASEEEHLKFCGETMQLTRKRRLQRSHTDALLDKSLKDLLARDVL